MGRHLSQDEAVALLRSFGFEPEGQFMSQMMPWPARHVACGRRTRVRLSVLKRAVADGRTGCMACGARERALARHAKTAEQRMQDAVAFMLECGFDPEVPYPGADVPWPSVHLACGQRVRPKLSYLRSGRGVTGCSHCARDRRPDR